MKTRKAARLALERPPEPPEECRTGKSKTCLKRSVQESTSSSSETVEPQQQSVPGKTNKRSKRSVQESTSSETVEPQQQSVPGKTNKRSKRSVQESTSSSSFASSSASGTDTLRILLEEDRNKRGGCQSSQNVVHRHVGQGAVCQHEWTSSERHIEAGEEELETHFRQSSNGPKRTKRAVQVSREKFPREVFTRAYVERQLCPSLFEPDAPTLRTGGSKKQNHDLSTLAEMENQMQLHGYTKDKMPEHLREGRTSILLQFESFLRWIAEKHGGEFDDLPHVLRNIPTEKRKDFEKRSQDFIESIKDFNPLDFLREGGGVTGPSLLRPLPLLTWQTHPGKLFDNTPEIAKLGERVRARHAKELGRKVQRGFLDAFKDSVTRLDVNLVGSLNVNQVNDNLPKEEVELIAKEFFEQVQRFPPLAYIFAKGNPTYVKSMAPSIQSILSSATEMEALEQELEASSVRRTMRMEYEQERREAIKFSCPECTEEFNLAADLEGHFFSKCHHCSKTFSRQRDYFTHCGDACSSHVNWSEDCANKSKRFSFDLTQHGITAKMNALDAVKVYRRGLAGVIPPGPLVESSVLARRKIIYRMENASKALERFEEISEKTLSQFPSKKT